MIMWATFQTQLSSAISIHVCVHFWVLFIDIGYAAGNISSGFDEDADINYGTTLSK